VNLNDQNKVCLEGSANQVSSFAQLSSLQE